MKLKTKMLFTRETKGALLYQDMGVTESGLTNIYIRKSLVNKPYPEEIIVTVEGGEKDE